jgi:hypothetical protein
VLFLIENVRISKIIGSKIPLKKGGNEERNPLKLGEKKLHTHTYIYIYILVDYFKCTHPT